MFINDTPVNDVVFIHGWGLNKAVWGDYHHAFSERFPDVRIHNLDIPGYGDLVEQTRSASLVDLAKSCLDQAPDQAIWVGWSLGGMIAMQAAILLEQDVTQSTSSNGNKRIQALQLINSTPKFVQSNDWPSGVDIAIFEKFSADLAADYQSTLATFLLLQAGANKGARAQARKAHDAIAQFKDPSAPVLMNGIDCLANGDLRADLNSLTQTTQVVLGTLDRVTKPDSSRLLAEMLHADLVEIHCGHAPFMTHEAQMLDAFDVLLQKVQPS